MSDEDTCSVVTLELKRRGRSSTSAADSHIEIAGGFVRQHDQRLDDDGPTHGLPRLVASRRRKVAREIHRHARACRRRRAARALSVRRLAPLLTVQGKRQRDVPLHAQVQQQMKGLEYRNPCALVASACAHHRRARRCPGPAVQRGANRRPAYRGRGNRARQCRFAQCRTRP